MREKVLKTVAGLHSRHPWRMLGVMVILTLVFGSLVFSLWHGFASLGAAMFVGVGGTFSVNGHHFIGGTRIFRKITM